jgi:hypothetical protein
MYTNKQILTPYINVYKELFNENEITPSSFVKFMLSYPKTYRNSMSYNYRVRRSQYSSV